ncbi:MAG: amino acid ABC transporter permease [Acidaminococcus sp.]|nr:amino acid ABC transporter permease [Acidaminococcus sp.]MDD7398227.1 amino acid ABC transporter permease [Bacillota bacterium]
MNVSFVLETLFQGFGKTVLLFVVTLVLALPLGLIISFGSMSKFKPLKYLIRAIVWIVRSTPLMLQILLVSFIPYYVFGTYTVDLAYKLNMEIDQLMFFFVAVAFVLNYACYFSEIYRGAIQAIPRGQYEAGKVLGLKKGQIFFRIVLFQVFRKILAPMSNEIITLVKDTALASVLGVIDLFTAAQNMMKTIISLMPLLYAGVFYLVFNGLLTILFSVLEKKMAFYKE